MNDPSRDDGHFARWLDRELPALAAAKPITVPPVLTVEATPSRALALPKAIAAASAMLLLTLGGGAVLAGRTAGNPSPAEVTPSASPSPTETATPTPAASPSGSPDASNAHGKAVSAAAHSCPKGPGGVHGKCVSAVARGTATAGSPKASHSSQPPEDAD